VDDPRAVVFDVAGDDVDFVGEVLEAVVGDAGVEEQGATELDLSLRTNLSSRRTSSTWSRDTSVSCNWMVLAVPRPIVTNESSRRKREP
jgi:hypothetical protein